MEENDYDNELCVEDSGSESGLHVIEGREGTPDPQPTQVSMANAHVICTEPQPGSSTSVPQLGSTTSIPQPISLTSVPQPSSPASVPQPLPSSSTSIQQTSSSTSGTQPSPATSIPVQYRHPKLSRLEE